jgi:hypothetical protein
MKKQKKHIHAPAKGVKDPKEKAAESGVSTAQRVFGKVLEKVDPKTKG